MLAVSTATGVPIRRDSDQLNPMATRATISVVAIELPRSVASASAWPAAAASARACAVAWTRAAAVLISPTMRRLVSVVIRAPA